MSLGSSHLISITPNDYIGGIKTEIGGKVYMLKVVNHPHEHYQLSYTSTIPHEQRHGKRDAAHEGYIILVMIRDCHSPPKPAAGLPLRIRVDRHRRDPNSSTKAGSGKTTSQVERYDPEQPFELS
jgi:hypothetical protein